MTCKNITANTQPLIESIDKLFWRFLVGKNQIHKEEEYNDGLSEADADNNSLNPVLKEESGWGQRILLDVEKQRVERVKVEQRLKDKRNALLMRYFQQSLLKAVNEKLENSDDIINNQLQFRETTCDLLITLLAGEPRYSILASLLDLDSGTRNRLLSLVGCSNFMGKLGREPRDVRDIHSAVGMVGIDVLRFLVPAILFKYRINSYSPHNTLFTKKLWRYELTLGQTCTALMYQENYRRPYEGLLLSVMINSAFVASYKQYSASFEIVRTACLDNARDKGEKAQHDVFFDIQTDVASLQALLMSHANLKLSLTLSEKTFGRDFPHLVNALAEQVNNVPFAERSKVGKILFKAVRFAKYDQLRASRLFNKQWLADYLRDSQIDAATYKKLVHQELFRFKPIWP